MEKIVIVRPTDEEIKAAGLHSYAFHFRNYWNTTWKNKVHQRYYGKASEVLQDEELELDPIGGETIVVISQIENGRVWLGRASCKAPDHYNRKMGYTLALAEALEHCVNETDNEVVSGLLSQIAVYTEDVPKPKFKPTQQVN